MEAHVLSAVVLVVIAPFVGSFLGTVIRRLPEGRPLLLGRSECEHCHRTLTWRDLVPVVSWLAARGRCRQCGAAIGAFYPAVELAALAVALWSVAVTPGWIAWAGAGLGWTLLTLAWIDGRHQLLPDALTLPLGAAGLAVAGLIDPGRLLHHGIGVVAGFGALAGLAWLYRRVRGRSGLGGGDAKLLGALGAWVGWWGLPTIVVYAALSGLVVALAMAARGERIALGHRLPFGPHLCLGGWLVWLYGPLIPA
jgi:leader peptidase (prepilin peptidase) / N-methyltransferase